MYLRAMLKFINRLPIAVWCILALSLWINSYAIGWGLPSFEGWAADELIPARVLNGIAKGFSVNWSDKYPPFHFYLLTLLYSPLLLLHQLKWVDLQSLETYTWLFYIGRFLSVIMGTAGVLFVYWCGCELYPKSGKSGAIFAALMTAMICPYVYYSKTINLDIPYLFWFLLSLLFYIRILKYQAFKDYLGFAIMAAIAVATKDQAYGFYILTPVFIIWQHYRYQKQQQPSITWKASLSDRKIVIPVLVGIGIFLLIHNIVFNFDGFFTHVRTMTSGSGKIRPRYPQNWLGQLQMFWQSWRHIRFSLGYPLYVVCLLGLFRAVFRFPQHQLLLSLLVPALSYYLFYISVVFYNDVRYLLPCCIILTLFGGKLIADFLTAGGKLYLVKSALVTGIFVYTLAYAFSVNIWMANDSRYYVETWMEQHIQPTDSIFTVGSPKYLPRFDHFSKQNVKNTDHPSLPELAKDQPDYIVLSSGYAQDRFEQESTEYKFFSRLKNRETNYQLILQHRYQAKPELLNFEELNYRDVEYMKIYSNFNRINPEISIFKRI